MCLHDDDDDDDDDDDLFLHRLCFCLEGFLMIDFLEFSRFVPNVRMNQNDSMFFAPTKAAPIPASASESEACSKSRWG